MPREHLDRPCVPVPLAGARVEPGGTLVGAHGINFSQRHVGIGKATVQTYGVKQQAERLLLTALRAVQLRQVVVRLRVGRFPCDPPSLLFDVMKRLLIEREIDHFFAPETHGCDPTRINCTSITLV